VIVIIAPESLRTVADRCTTDTPVDRDAFAETAETAANRLLQHIADLRGDARQCWGTHIDDCSISACRRWTWSRV
jgi:hypothetical protein